MTDAPELPEPPSTDGALEKYINYEQGVLQHAISVADAKATAVMCVWLPAPEFATVIALGRALASATSTLRRFRLKS